MATYNDYPQSAVNNAKKALRHRDENGSSCGTRVGWVRANQIANRENLSDDTVKRVYSFLSRAATYNTGSYFDENGNEVCGTIMYDAWGGASMLRWAEPIAKRLRENAMNMQELEINGEVGEWGVNAAMISATMKEKNGSDLLVTVTSPGGSVMEGFAIADAIKAYPGEVTTEGRGYVASIASIILLAGDKVRMAENAFLMIHNPWSAAEGDASDLRKTAAVLEKMEMQIAEVYAQSMMKRKGMRYQDAFAKALQYMDAETWFTANEAKDVGLIDEVLIAKDYTMDTFSALGRFTAVPMALLDNYKIEEKMKKGFMEKFLALFDEVVEQEAVTPVAEADPIAEARQLLESNGYAVFSESEAEVQEHELESVMNQAAEKIKAMQAELAEAKAQLKNVAGAPSGGNVAPGQAKRNVTGKEKAFDALAAMLKDARN